MKNKEILVEKFYQMANLLIQEMQTPWSYGGDFLLSHSEIHLLEAIKSQEGANVSELAAYLEITSGAVSQGTKKLLDKELIESYKKKGNRKETFSRLTPLGERICEGHRKHHECMWEVWQEFMTDLDQNETQLVSDFLEMVTQGITQMIAQGERRLND
ncbi:MarR family transcriptional regulator [Lacrimispora aerotolerans]|uniref:MarR family transcriptional regulator n=1 Tax=Lacrimispora aerotolerans TaxID=36832 RepID=UPI000A02E756|nr:MarR family transcriptional regulator [Lacrimispora aerotolerans]